jgi:hypothetical protein
MNKQNLIKLELTHEELNDIRELLAEKLDDAEEQMVEAEMDGSQAGYEKAQHDVCKFEDLALAFSEVSINNPATA